MFWVIAILILRCRYVNNQGAGAYDVQEDALVEWLQLKWSAFRLRKIPS